jgi:hypothetical protein
MLAHRRRESRLIASITDGLEGERNGLAILGVVRLPCKDCDDAALAVDDGLGGAERSRVR